MQIISHNTLLLTIIYKIINKQKVPRETSSLCLVIIMLNIDVDKIIFIMFHVKHSFPQPISNQQKKGQIKRIEMVN